MKRSKTNKKSAGVRWAELIELNQLKETESPDEWDTYYTDDYYELIESYQNNYSERGDM